MSMHGTEKNKLAMVDLDGTLVNTLQANYMAYKKALNEAGFDISREYYGKNCDGRSYKAFLPEIMGADHPAMETVHERKKVFYAQCVEETQLNDHLIHILRGLKPTYYLALVTTASKENVNRILEYFGLEDFFDRVMTQEDMTRCKPEPDCYLETLAAFGLEREDAVIFEDSETGIKAARASGCAYFCIKNWP